MTGVVYWFALRERQKQREEPERTPPQASLTECWSRRRPARVKSGRFQDFDPKGHVMGHYWFLLKPEAREQGPSGMCSNPSVLAAIPADTHPRVPPLPLLRPPPPPHCSLRALPTTVLLPAACTPPPLTSPEAGICRRPMCAKQVHRTVLSSCRGGHCSKLPEFLENKMHWHRSWEEYFRRQVFYWDLCGRLWSGILVTLCSKYKGEGSQQQWKTKRSCSSKEEQDQVQLLLVLFSGCCIYLACSPLLPSCPFLLPFPPFFSFFKTKSVFFFRKLDNEKRSI